MRYLPRVCVLFVTLFALPLCLPKARAQADNGPSLQQKIEAVRTKVYPALVNIKVVMRYYNEGRTRRSLGGGSGVIVDPEGHVLTNYHVAGNTLRILCTLPGGEEFDASVVVHDPMTDLSVLKLNLADRRDPKTPLPFAQLGDSDKLDVGEQVLAMGNPMMLSSSMTLGIVSNAKRVFTDFTGSDMEDMTLDAGERTGLFTRWIQHDALILPGNSGGPLVNLKGEVVGINELGGGGVGFAIPSNIAKWVLSEALKSGRIERGWLGISVLPTRKAGSDRGALVSAVWPGSPATDAGLKPGDILLELDNKPTTARFFEEVPLVQQLMAGLKPGSSVPVKYLRDGKEATGTIKVALMDRFVGKEDELRDMGVTYQEITPPMAMLRRLPDNKGVLITSIRAGYPFEAAKPSIQPGDIVLSVGNQVTATPTDFLDAIKATTKAPFSITYRRKEEVLLTVVHPHEDKPDSDSKEIPKAWLGVKTQVITPEMADSLKLKGTRGFRISEVYPFTEASNAKLQIGDIITGVNNHTLTAFRPQDSEELKTAVEELTIGANADLSILREGKPTKLKVKLEEEPANVDQAKKAKQKELEFAVRDIMRMDRIERHLTKDQPGVLVNDVTEGGLANVAGLQVDDIILAINGKSVTNVDSFTQVTQEVLKTKPRTVMIFLQRDYRTHFIFIEPEWSRLSAD